METEDQGEQFEEWRQGAMGLYQAGMLADASEAQLVVVQLAEQLYGQESRELAHEFGFLGLIYKKLGILDRAEDCYTFAVAALRQAEGEDSVELALQLNNLGVLYKQQDRLEEASQLYEESLNIIRRQPPGKAKEADIASGLINLAALKEILGNKDEARRLYAQAIEIARTLGQDYQPVLIRALSNLGNLVSMSRQFALAESLLREALNLSQQTYGTDHPEFATTQMNLAYHLIALRRDREAIELLKPACARLQASLGPSHPLTVKGEELLAQAEHNLKAQ